MAPRVPLQILEDFPSLHLPLPWLLQLVPTLQPRRFSIASSETAHPRKAHLTVAVVDYKVRQPIPFYQNWHTAGGRVDVIVARSGNMPNLLNNIPQHIACPFV
jgi:hypothetical protein